MATYFLRADGTAANKAAATGPASDATKCMSLATHNAETFAAVTFYFGSPHRKNMAGGKRE
jgi:hypothetical protein